MMKINRIKANINEFWLDKKLKNGINFIYYKNGNEKIAYQKALQLAFDEAYYADDFYENNEVNVIIEMTDGDIVFTLKYEQAELDGNRVMGELLLIQGKPAQNEISKWIVESYLKKNGYARVFDCCEDYVNNSEPKDIICKCIQKEEDEFTCKTTELWKYLNNIAPVFINKHKDCRLMLLSNGEFYIEGENEDDDEQFVLTEYFKFAITARMYDMVEKADLCAYGYPLFVYDLFEEAGDSADMDAIFEIFKGYDGQIIYLCPESMREELSEAALIDCLEIVDEEVLPF